MGRAKGIALALIAALAPLALDACGDVSANPQATVGSAGGATGGTKTDSKRRSKGGMKKQADADTGGVAGAAGAPGGPSLTEHLDPAQTCSICVRAENCCKAEGLTDCNYGVLCANATPSEQSQFYLVLCRAVLEASRSGDKAPPDICGF